MKKLRVAVVGVGRWGSLHAEKYSAIEDVELVGVVDQNPERAREVASQLGVKAFSHHSEIAGLVDAASVTVPTTIHHAVARDLFEAGIHLLVEKPIAASLAEADGLIAAARASGRILQIGHLERYNAAVRVLEGKVVRPLFIECHRLGPFSTRGLDVDVVLDLMIHDLDIISSWAGRDVVFVHAVGVPVVSSNVDIANARIEFASGCVANVTASRVSVERTRKIRIFQPDAYLSISYDERKVSILKREPPASGQAHPQLSADSIELPVTDSLMDEVRDFVLCVRRGTAPRVSGEDGRAALALADEINRSIQAHRDRVTEMLVGEGGGAGPVPRPGSA